MPKVSPTMTAGRLIVWKKQEGEAFEEGEDIADVESDKATMPISAREEGFMAKILVPEDTPDIPLGRILAITVEEEDFIPAFKNYVPLSEAGPDAPAGDGPPPLEAASAAAPQASVPAAALTSEYTGPKGPAIMRLLNEFPTLNLNAITPTGPQGRMLKGDVLAAIAGGTAFGSAPAAMVAKPAAAPQAEPATMDLPGMPAYTDVPVSSMRRAIAKRLVQSKTGVPHRYASFSYQLDNLLALRKRLNSVEPSPKISVNDFMIRAIGTALRRVPEMNVVWDDVNKQAIRSEAADVSMAVAIEGGLITPIVTRVDSRGLADIAATTKDLVARAREGTLAPEEFEGGSFSVSNLGMLGISKFSAIINPPQSGILALGSGSKLTVRGCVCAVIRMSCDVFMVSDNVQFFLLNSLRDRTAQRAVMSEDGTLKTVTEGMATLSTDARAVEEETAAEFLNEFSRCISNPENMLM